MSLRRKDDWDEALEEARNNTITRDEITPAAAFIPDPDYDYGNTVMIQRSEIRSEDTKKCS
jgi:hypothetical protein